MDESQFFRLLGLFPMVRTRDYCADDVESSGPLVFSDFEAPTALLESEQASESVERDSAGEQESLLDASLESEVVNGSGKVSEESSVEAEPQTNGSHKVLVSFWERLQQEVETKLGQAEAQRFCDAFRAQHNDLVNKTLSLDTIDRIASKLDLVQK